MEGLRSLLDKASDNLKSISAVSNNPPILNVSSGGGGGGVSSALLEQSHVLVTRSSRRVSVLTCSKLCAFFFVTGIIVGYTLKRRVKSWASRLLKRLKDD